MKDELQELSDFLGTQIKKINALITSIKMTEQQRTEFLLIKRGFRFIEKLPDGDSLYTRPIVGEQHWHAQIDLAGYVNGMSIEDYFSHLKNIRNERAG